MDPKKRREFPIYQTHMAFLAVFAVVCLFSLFGPCSPEPRFGVGVSLPVCHAEIRLLFLKYRVCYMSNSDISFPSTSTFIMLVKSVRLH